MGDRISRSSERSDGTTPRRQGIFNPLRRSESSERTLTGESSSHEVDWSKLPHDISKEIVCAEYGRRLADPQSDRNQTGEVARELVNLQDKISLGKLFSVFETTTSNQKRLDIIEQIRNSNNPEANEQLQKKISLEKRPAIREMMQICYDSHSKKE